MSFLRSSAEVVIYLITAKINIDKDELVKKNCFVYLNVLTLFNPVP